MWCDTVDAVTGRSSAVQMDSPTWAGSRDHLQPHRVGQRLQHRGDVDVVGVLMAAAARQDP